MCNFSKEHMWLESDVGGEGHACKLRTDKKVAGLSIGWVIFDWRTYKQIQWQMILRGRKEEKLWTRCADCILTHSDLSCWLCLTFLLEQLHKLMSYLSKDGWGQVHPQVDPWVWGHQVSGGVGWESEVGVRPIWSEAAWSCHSFLINRGSIHTVPSTVQGRENRYQLNQGHIVHCI